MATVLIVAPVYHPDRGRLSCRCCFASSRGRVQGHLRIRFQHRDPCPAVPHHRRLEFPDTSPEDVGAPITGRGLSTWIVPMPLSALLRKRREDREDGVVFAIGSVYGNIVMLGIPLTLSALGNEAAGRWRRSCR